MKKIKYEKVILYMAVFTFLFTAGLSQVQARNIEADYTDGELRRAEMVLEALESEDYAIWKKLIGPNSKLAKTIDEKSFAEYLSARRLARNGKYDEAVMACERLSREMGLNQSELEQISRQLEMFR